MNFFRANLITHNVPDIGTLRVAGAESLVHGSGAKRRAYVLLETVFATGLMIAGLAVIGAQLQDSNAAVRKMDRRIHAMALAETQLAELGLGLIELDTVDAIQEEDFGPRYVEWGWRVTIEKTAIERMFLLRLDVLHLPRQEYNDTFDFDEAELVHTVYTMRPAPQPLDLASDFGLSETQTEELAQKLAEAGEGLDINNFDPSIFAKLPFDDLIGVLPVLLEAFGVSIDDIVGALPADVRKALEESGVLGGGVAGQSGDGTGGS